MLIKIIKKNLLRYLLIILVPILAITYAFGDQLRWWDDWSGRTQAQAGLNKLKSSKGYPETWIYNDEREFSALEKLINENTSNPIVIQKVNKRSYPSLISRAHTETLSTNVPKDWADPTFVPETALILYVYGATRNSSNGQTTWVGNLGDVRRWIEQSRNAERFYVNTVLIGLLAFGVAVMGIVKDIKDNSEKNTNKGEIDKTTEQEDNLNSVDLDIEEQKNVKTIEKLQNQPELNVIDRTTHNLAPVIVNQKINN